MTRPLCLFCASEKQERLGNYRDKARSMNSDSPFYDALIYECDACGVAYAYPLPSEKVIREYYSSVRYWKEKTRNVDFAGQEWSRLFNIDPGLNTRMWRAIRLYNYIGKQTTILEKAPKVLEIGCGWAAFLYLCRENGIRDLSGLEPSEAVARYLSNQGLNVANASVEAFLERGSSEKYDLVVLSHVIEHLRDPVSIMGGIKAILANDGLLCLEVPYRDDLQNDVVEGHVSFFDRESIKAVLGGYMILDSKRFQSAADIRDGFGLAAVGSKLFKTGIEIVAESDSIERIGPFAWERTMRSTINGELYVGLVLPALAVICAASTE
ncbi:class I SAM-dependent methyltransferase [Gammaproteobacteria bacterium]|nr:class I SAM-dependent methyltransferase [Gammaproteobacteria bacterium]